MDNAPNPTSMSRVLNKIVSESVDQVNKSLAKINWPEIDRVAQLAHENNTRLLADCDQLAKLVVANNERLLAEIIDPVTQSLARMVIPEFKLASLPEIRLPDIIFPIIDLGIFDKRFREMLILLGRGGWYLYEDVTIDDTANAANEIAMGDFAAADARMCSILEQDYETIKGRVFKEFPRRAPILSRAFQAHERGEYELSIPVFLAQADGMCQEIVSVQLYSRRGDKKPKTTDVVMQAALDSFELVILAPLMEALPLMANPVERLQPDYPAGSLNRHQVLHGESVDYGTRVNSFKAISLLCYLCDTLKTLIGKTP